MAKIERKKICKPKRALKKYYIYVREIRNTSEGRNLSFPDFVKLCRNKWKKLSEPEKNQYEMKANAENGNKKFAPKSMKVNKRPLLELLDFAKSELPKLEAEHPDWTAAQEAREILKKWEFLSVNQKLKFKKMAEKKMELSEILLACRNLRANGNEWDSGLSS